MKILHIMAARTTGGAETYSTDIMLSLHQEGEVEQLCVVAPDAPRTDEMCSAGVHLNTDVLRTRFRFLQRRRLKQLIEKEHPDLIHCWMRRAASLMPKWPHCPVIGWFGGYYDPKNFNRCTHFIGCTADIARHTAEKGAPQDRCYYIPTFPTVKDEPAVNRASLDTPEEVPLILALSRLHQKKGLDTLLNAIKDIPEAYLWLAGDGPLEAQLKKQTKQLGLDSRVRFLGWRTDRGALLGACDICTMPSRYEPFGTVILESWAARKPFVAAASAGPKAHIRDCENGLLVPIDDVAALREALSRAIKDKALCERMVEAGYNEYISCFTREAVTKELTDLYGKMIKDQSIYSHSE